MQKYALSILTALGFLLPGCADDPCVSLCKDTCERYQECGYTAGGIVSDDDVKECKDLCEENADDSASDAECEAASKSLDAMSCEEFRASQSQN